MHHNRKNLEVEVKRVHPSEAQKKRLRDKNAHVCCICKERNIGDNFHHIDGDSSNTVDANLAVLCVRHHDNHHRPEAYNHLNLNEAQIRKAKQRWEAFVEEAQKDNPEVFATINLFGTEERVDSMKLVFQWEDGTIEFERLYHSHSGTPEQWIDYVLEEIQWLGGKLKLVLINAPVDIEFCTHCNQSLSTTVDPNTAKKINEENWDTDSICSIYVNPEFPSLAILISLTDEVIYQGHIHLCGKNIRYVDDKKDQIMLLTKKPSIRTQVTNLVAGILMDWNPGHIFIGTGDPNKPLLIDDLELPRCWELVKNSNKHNCRYKRSR